MMIKNLMCAGLFLILLMGHSTALAENDWRQLVKWHDYNEVLPEKNSSSQKILIYFFSKRCGYCRMLEKKALSDKTITNYINDNYTAILVNTDKERELSEKSGVNGVPDLRFLTAKGEPIARLPGYVPPETLLNLLQYINTDSYKTMALNDFVKKKNRN